MALDVKESVQKLGRSISSGRPGLRQGCMVCSVHWSVPAWRCCPDAFAVTRGGYLERRDAAGREFPFKTATLTCAMQCAPSSVQRICRFLAMRWLTTWFTADSAMLLLIGRPLRCRAP